MPKVTERTANGAAKKKAKPAKRRAVGHGWRKPTPEEAEREIAKDRELIKFLSQPATHKRKNSSQKVERWLANYEALLEETRKLAIEPFDAEDLDIQEHDER